MNFELNNGNLGNWLAQLNGKTVGKIFEVDSNHRRLDDTYLPQLFIVTITDFDKFLQIEGDLDGSHIRIDVDEICQLEEKLKENNRPECPDLWSVYDTSPEEKLHKLIGQKITYIEFGIDKDEYVINGRISKGQKDVFTYIRFYCETDILTIFAGSATGLSVSTDPRIRLDFEETFDVYDTMRNNR